jgi:WD40 repeat protein/tetratricopeptide (TPR) repeat protein
MEEKMAKAKLKPLNPYIAGSPLGGEEGFFGREDILRLVEAELRSPHQNAVVLYGQRRIGKTSILMQLERRLPESDFVPVYLDLMGRARRPLGEVLAELARKVGEKLGLEDPSHFDDEGRYFHEGFLPAVFKALDKGEAVRRLVFLFDEFDVLDVLTAGALSETAAAWSFFPYLRELMTQEKRLGFVIVVGRKTEELSADFRAAFRAARYQKISVLKEIDARALICQTEDEGSLRYTSAAVDRILALTAGHPLFTQLTCSELFNRAWSGEVEGMPLVDAPDVDMIVPQVLEGGDAAFEWAWDGLPPLGRVIFSAIAGSVDEHGMLSEDQIIKVLQQHGIRFLIHELKLAPRTLVEWEMLSRVDSSYRFFIEMMRRWVAKNKRLAEVKDELDRVNLEADQHYRDAHVFFQRDNMPKAADELRQALSLYPYHLKARLLLGEVLLEQHLLDEAVHVFEDAYKYDRDEARSGLVKALRQYGDKLRGQDRFIQALDAYSRILEISPDEPLVSQQMAEVSKEGMGRERRRRVVWLSIAGVVIFVLLIATVSMLDQRNDYVGVLDGYQAKLAEAQTLMTQEAAGQASLATQVRMAWATQTQVVQDFQTAIAQSTQVAVAAEAGRVATQVAQTATAEPTQTAAARAATRVAMMEAISSSDQPLLTISTHRSRVEAMAYSPNGQQLATGLADGNIVVWELATSRETYIIEGHMPSVSAMAYSPDGEWLVSASGLDIKLWDAVSGRELQTLQGHTGRVTSVAFSPDGQQLASGSFDNKVLVWNLGTGTQERLLRGDGDIYAVAYSPDGHQLAAGSYKEILFWDLTTRAEPDRLETDDGVAALVFSPDGNQLAAGLWDGTILLWNLTTARVQATLDGHKDRVRWVFYSPDGQQLVSISDSHTILWDLTLEQQLLALEKGGVATAYRPVSHQLASGQNDAVALWDLQTEEEVQRLERGLDVRSVTYRPDGQQLAAGLTDRNILLWDLRTGREGGTLRGHEAEVWAATYSPNGQQLASGSADGVIILWDPATGERERILGKHEDAVQALAYSPDGLQLASASSDDTIVVWDLETGAKVETLEEHTGDVLSIAYSLDGQHLASGSGDQSIILWDSVTGQVVRTLRGHKEPVTSVVYSPDGNQLASGSFDDTIILWSTETGERIQTLRGHTDNVLSVAFSPDGKWLASGSTDGTAALWNLSTPEVFRILRGHNALVRSVVFSPDGNLLASGGDDDVIRLWVVP